VFEIPERNLFSAAAQLFRELEMARADGGYVPRKLRGLGQVDVLIVDDWAMAGLGFDYGWHPG
jgi:DNA replication protein DnaC